MTDYPIKFNGRKTQMRRVMKPQPDHDSVIDIGQIGTSKGVAYVGNSNSSGIRTRVTCPYGQPGDRMWVRDEDLASRTLLEITNVRIERLQDISQDDCLAEGIDPDDGYELDDVSGAITYRPVFEYWWDSIYAKRGYSWESNPWVWVVEFKRC